MQGQSPNFSRERERERENNSLSKKILSIFLSFSLVFSFLTIPQTEALADGTEVTTVSLGTVNVTVSQDASGNYIATFTPESGETGEITSIEKLQTLTNFKVISKVVMQNKLTAKTSLRDMFRECSLLADISDLKNLDVSEVNDTSNMFYNCSSLEDISAVYNWDFSNNISMSGMFGQTAVKKIDLTFCNQVGDDQYVHYLINATDTIREFKLTSTKERFISICGDDLSSPFSIEYLTRDTVFPDTRFHYLLQDGTKYYTYEDFLDNVDKYLGQVVKIIEEKGKIQEADLGGVKAYVSGNVLHFEPNSGDSGLIDGLYHFRYLNGLEGVTKIESHGKISVKGKIGEMFSELRQLSDISGLANWDVSEVTDMSMLFHGCGQLKYITALKNWNVGKVQSMEQMFYNASIASLEPIYQWDLSSVITMNWFLVGSSEITDIDLRFLENVTLDQQIGEPFRDLPNLRSFTLPKTKAIFEKADSSTFRTELYAGSKTSLSYYKTDDGQKFSTFDDLMSNYEEVAEKKITMVIDHSVSLGSVRAYMVENEDGTKTVHFKPESGDSGVISSIKEFSEQMSTLGFGEANSIVSEGNITVEGSMDLMFYNWKQLTFVSGLENWDVSKVTSMVRTFSMTNVQSFSFMKDWRLSGEINLDLIFEGCPIRTLDLSFLNNCTVVLSPYYNAPLSYMTAIREVTLTTSLENFKLIGSDTALNVAWLNESLGRNFHYEIDGETVTSYDDLIANYSKYAGKVMKIVDDEKAEVKVNITGPGIVEINNRQFYTSGETFVVSKGLIRIGWKPEQATKRNIALIKSIKVNGVEQGAVSKIDKSRWQTNNRLYQELMGDSTAELVDYDTVTSVGGDVTVDVTDDVTIDVELAEYVPVYRLYNQITSEHLFTTNKTEYDTFVLKCEIGEDVWIGEGIDWFAEVTPETANDNTVRRFYNAALGAMGSSSHYYSKDATEIATLLQNGWVDDGPANYIQSGGDVPIWTCYNEALGSAHHYTSNKTEWEGLSVHGWALGTDKNLDTGVFQAVMSAKP